MEFSNDDGFGRRDTHVRYFARHLVGLPSAYQGQDALRMTLLYFAVAGLDLLGALGTEDQRDQGAHQALEAVFPGGADRVRDVCAEWVLSNFVVTPSGDRGGYRGSPQHPEPATPHLAMTYAALCTLCIVGAPSPGEKERKLIVNGIRSCQRSDGSFAAWISDDGRDSGESDVRFSFCALASLRLVGVCPTAAGVDVPSLEKFLASCASPGTGGFGQFPGQEPHGGSSYCAIAALRLVGRGGQVRHDDPICTAAALGGSSDAGAEVRDASDAPMRCLSRSESLFQGLRDDAKGIDLTGGGAGARTARWLLSRIVPHNEGYFHTTSATDASPPPPPPTTTTPTTTPTTTTTKSTVDDQAGETPAHEPPTCVHPHGMHGRVHKDEDTCYTWWVGASLSMLRALPLLSSPPSSNNPNPNPGGAQGHADCASRFVSANASPIGGFKKHPLAPMPDPLHSYLALAGWGLLTGGKGARVAVPEVGVSQRALAVADGWWQG